MIKYTNKLTVPYMDNITVEAFADLVSASIFHKGMIHWLLYEIQDALTTEHEQYVANEGEKIQMLLKMVGPGRFRATYKFDNDEKVRAMNILTDGENYEAVADHFASD